MQANTLVADDPKAFVKDANPQLNDINISHKRIKKEVTILKETIVKLLDNVMKDKNIGKVYRCGFFKSSRK